MAITLYVLQTGHVSLQTEGERVGCASYRINGGYINNFMDDQEIEWSAKSLIYHEVY
jgi:hypothetical protein